MTVLIVTGSSRGIRRGQQIAYRRHQESRRMPAKPVQIGYQGARRCVFIGSGCFRLSEMALGPGTVNRIVDVQLF